MLKALSSLKLFTDLPPLPITEHAAENSLEEVCGVWTKSKGIIPLKNYAEDKAQTFGFSANTWAWINSNKDTVVGIYHSHPSEYQAAKLSVADIRLARSHDLDICIYHPIFKQWDYYSPSIPHPYPLDLDIETATPTDLDWWVGHVYEPSRSDCYALVCDWYFANFGIKLNHPLRTDTDYGRDRTKVWNRLIDEALREGWKLKQGMPTTGDVAVLRIDAVNPNHCGIILKDDNANDESAFKFLHQLGGKRQSEVISFKEVSALCCGIYTQD